MHKLELTVACGAQTLSGIEHNFVNSFLQQELIYWKPSISRYFSCLLITNGTQFE